MLHFIAKVAERLQPYIPLMQSLTWPVFLGLVIYYFRRQIPDCIETLRQRIERGSSLKAGPLEIGEDLKALEYAPPAPPIMGTAIQDKEPNKDWMTERNAIYKANSGLFLTHVLEPSKTVGQAYDIFIYVIRHKTTDLTDIDNAEFYFGHMWGNRIFREYPKQHILGIRTSAYGPFLCICRIHLKDGSVIKLQRYIDFEMGRAFKSQQRDGASMRLSN